MDITVTVTSVNDGPAPFDVFASNDDCEVRVRFYEKDPQVEVGTQITVSYTPVDTPSVDAGEPDPQGAPHDPDPEGAHN